MTYNKMLYEAPWIICLQETRNLPSNLWSTFFIIFQLFLTDEIVWQALFLTIEILPSDGCDFPILYFYLC